jgi:hypothetical protein
MKLKNEAWVFGNCLRPFCSSVADVESIVKVPDADCKEL